MDNFYPDNFPFSKSEPIQNGKNVFRNENFDSKNFLHYEFSLGDIAVFIKMGVIGQKCQRQFFLMGIDSESSKSYFEIKVSSLKNFLLMTFLWGRSHFFENVGDKVSISP